VLDLSYNFIEDITGFSSINLLDDLNLSHNKITDISELSENKNLM
jgi:Leucine-rich repeat (LRR) protein